MAQVTCPPRLTFGRGGPLSSRCQIVQNSYSEEIAEAIEQTQVDPQLPAADTEPEIQSDVPAAITETKIDGDEENPEDSGNAESELAETPNVESPDSEEDK